MTAVSTHTYSYTRTHTATFLTDVILGAIGDMLADLGIDLGKFHSDWPQDESAIAAWIREGSLAAVILECRQPSGTVAPVVEFPVTYTTSGDGDTSFAASRARLARFRAKIDKVPAGTTYQLLCTFSKARTEQPGWGPAHRTDTEGMRGIVFGTLGSAPHAVAGMRYLRP